MESKEYSKKWRYANDRAIRRLIDAHQDEWDRLKDEEMIAEGIPTKETLMRMLKDKDK